MSLTPSEAIGPVTPQKIGIKTYNSSKLEIVIDENEEMINENICTVILEDAYGKSVSAIVSRDVLCGALSVAPLRKVDTVEKIYNVDTGRYEWRK